MAEGQCGRQFFGDAFDIDHVIIDRCFSSETEILSRRGRFDGDKL